MVSRLSLSGASVLALLAGCSLVNAPDDVVASGGNGGTVTGGGGSGAGGDGGTGGAEPECSAPADCAHLTTDCTTGVCTDGACVAENKPEGTACGQAPTSTCDEPDVCDANGACVDSRLPDGTYCEDCPAGPGLCGFCSAGACPDCTTRATIKTFRTPTSTAGWEFTGSWGLFLDTPDSVHFDGPRPSEPFSRGVLGSDGNRFHPYGSPSEREISSATSPPTILPANLEFRSWNADEGLTYDLKAVQITVDGINYANLHVCTDEPPTVAYCAPREDARAIDDWDDISLPVPVDLVGQVGRVRFLYDTIDDCCGWEKGWYIDSLNFATDCGCDSDASCVQHDGPCSDGVCETATGECTLGPKNLGGQCPLGVSDDCSDASCDALGFCNPHFGPFEGQPCATCADGSMDCFQCEAGVCQDCRPLQFFSVPAMSWAFGGKWGISGCFPASNSVAEPECVAEADEAASGPWLSNPGSRSGTFGPYDPLTDTPEDGTVTMGPTYLPAELTFRSWHLDKGGNNVFENVDRKTIRGTVDGGASWVTIIDCEGNNEFPFCQPFAAGDSRAVDDWDDVTIPMPAALAEQFGYIEITYRTITAGEGWERGWAIDDLNVVRCDGPQ